MNRTIGALVSPFVAAVVALGACSGDESTVDEPSTPTASEPAADPEATDPPATDPPATDPPATDPPATEPVEAEPADGYRFESPDGTITAVFPAEPEESELPVTLDDGSTLVSPLYVLDQGDSAYFVSWTDLPVSVAPGEVASVLEGSRDGAIGNIGGVLESSTEIERSGRPGLDFRGTAQLQGMAVAYQAVVFVEGDRLYQASTIAEQGSEQEAAGRAFPDSFAFLEASS